MVDIHRIKTNPEVFDLYNKQKTEFHFQQKTDNDFVMFLLDTAVRVVSIVQHLAPVIEAVSEASSEEEMMLEDALERGTTFDTRVQESFRQETRDDYPVHHSKRPCSRQAISQISTLPPQLPQSDEQSFLQFEKELETVAESLGQSLNESIVSATLLNIPNTSLESMVKISDPKAEPVIPEVIDIKDESLNESVIFPSTVELDQNERPAVFPQANQPLMSYAAPLVTNSAVPDMSNILTMLHFSPTLPTSAPGSSTDKKIDNSNISDPNLKHSRPENLNIKPQNERPQERRFYTKIPTSIKEECVRHALSGAGFSETARIFNKRYPQYYFARTTCSYWAKTLGKYS